MEKLIRPIAIVFVLFLLSGGCARNNKKFLEDWQEDGIVFLEKDEPGVKKKKKPKKKENAAQIQVKPGPQKSTKNKAKEKKKKEKPKPSQQTKVDGIAFLDYENQMNVYSGKPINFVHKHQQGNASYYADELHGKKTASGEKYDKTKFTAAHRKLEFGTRVRVTNLYNDRSVIVKINDRGPYADNRLIDLSYAAAEKLGMLKSGVVPVLVEVLRSEK